LKEPDDVSENACGHRPDESGKGVVTLLKALQVGREEVERLSQKRPLRAAFCRGESFHSIVIVAGFPVSKFSRVLKKLAHLFQAPIL
jgi:hypothetical protein